MKIDEYVNGRRVWTECQDLVAALELTGALHDFRHFQPPLSSVARLNHTHHPPIAFPWTPGTAQYYG